VRVRVLRPHHTGREEGSVLALVPAGFIVLILLGALAVDSAVAYLGQQQLHDAITAAANDAAGAAIDNALFYRSGRVALDSFEARSVVCESIDAQHFSQLRDVHVSVATDGPDITVVATATVDAVFGRALPGFSTRSVSARVDAVAETAAGAPPVSQARGTPVAVSCPSP
jgi:hypothetical protein